jgi:hypothetical protein
MGIERRRDARWRAGRNNCKALIRHPDGSILEATVVDLSYGGIGLRAERHAFQPSTPLEVEFELGGEVFQVPGKIRFIDRYYPRIGIQAGAHDLMRRVVKLAQRGDFLRIESSGDTLSVHGSLTWAAYQELESRIGCGHKKLDLSRVSHLSLAGVSGVVKAARAGVKIDRCSEATVTHFERLGICTAKLCTSQEPCELYHALPEKTDPRLIRFVVTEQIQAPR